MIGCKSELRQSAVTNRLCVLSEYAISSCGSGTGAGSDAGQGGHEGVR
jgi:hypothetical protein